VAARAEDIRNAVEAARKEAETGGNPLELTREHLMELKQPSPSEWPKIGGYLLYITDRESAGYWRPYIGQSNDLGR
jgi:hypothetical protein